MQVCKWDIFELSLRADAPGNPFIDVTLEAAFTFDNRTLVVQGFYDGSDTYRLRLMPDAEGEWHYVTKSNLPSLDNRQGTFTCTPAAPGIHGPVRVAGRTHFAYSDDTPYRPIGTTCYVWNHQGPDLEQRTLATLQNAPFNKMRMCVFPKRYVYNTNEPLDYPFPGAPVKPWNWDLAAFSGQPHPVQQDGWDLERFNPAYFRRLEQKVAELGALGIEADLILFHPYDYGAWDFDRLPVAVNDRYLAYLVARLGAYRNVWWSLANEFDLMRERPTADWDHYFQLLQAIDPYDHLRSIHNGYVFYDHTQPWVTHCSIQSSELEHVPEWLQKYDKPVVVDECGYEGDIPHAWGSLSAEALVEFFWQGYTTGGYVGHGETYLNPQERLWWSKGGELQGESTTRIAFLREVIDAVPGSGLSCLQPRSEAAHVFSYGVYKGMAAGHSGEDYYLLYMARHQPRQRLFHLPEDKHYRIDLLDTWNMTVTCLQEAASGRVQVELPGRKYLALRLVRIG
ncbi:MAG: DUF5605 domain-containing protein [Anaerolineae bacterium]